MTADEIVHKIHSLIRDNVGDPYHIDGDNYGVCWFCDEYQNKPHADDCLWLEIEKSANRCTESAEVHGLSCQCILQQDHDGLHQCKGNSAKINEWVFTWRDEITFYSNDPLVIGTDTSVE